MIPALRMLLLVVPVLALTAASAAAQAVAGPEKARPVQGDPGISSMVVIDQPAFRVLRDYAEPGATRRMHSHNDAAYHVFVLVTGELQLTVDGSEPVKVTPGEALSLAGGARHTFTNTGTVAATIVEVFGKAPARAGEIDRLAALAAVFAGAPSPSTRRR